MFGCRYESPMSDYREKAVDCLSSWTSLFPSGNWQLAWFSRSPFHVHFVAIKFTLNNSPSRQLVKFNDSHKNSSRATVVTIFISLHVRYDLRPLNGFQGECFLFFRFSSYLRQLLSHNWARFYHYYLKRAVNIVHHAKVKRKLADFIL